jgi:methylenetetrahydrofolate dehydrogenase (NADP+)/methenyltetrahydrofolate cyclohydrolase
VIIDGKAIAAQIKEEVKRKVELLEKKPRLDVIIVGDDAASAVYVRNKQAACAYTGIKSEVHALPASTSQEDVLALVRQLNECEDVSGILVQLPLPKHINEQAVICAISPQKDVDCFHPENVGRVSIGAPRFKPCTPAGIIELLKRSEIKMEGTLAVVIGRSNIVGKPLSSLLLAENATVITCHSKTANLAAIARQADILCAAVGKPKFVTADMVKEGAVVIDVGIHETGVFTQSGKRKMCGDVDFDNIVGKVSAITPVPGGVGPTTVAMLMKNCVASVVR